MLKGLEAFERTGIAEGCDSRKFARTWFSWGTRFEKLYGIAPASMGFF